jgi:hypothetical protein
MRATKVSRILFVVLMSAFLLTGWQAWAEEQNAGKPGPPEQAQASASKIKVAYKVSLADLAKKLPTKLMVYRTSLDPQGASQVQAVKKFFGDGKNVFAEVPKNSGGLFAADLDRLWARVPGIDEQVPPLDEKKIRTAANSFLSEIKGIPVGTRVSRFSNDTVEMADKEGKRRTLPFGANLTYRRVVNGYRVVGPGGKIKVFHDIDGLVAGYLRVWRSLKAEKKRSLVNVFKAAETFDQNPLGDTLLADISRVNVNKINLAYLERGVNHAQSYLQPIYVFDCTAFYKGSESTQSTRFTRYVAALSEPPEPLMPQGQVYQSDPRPKR